jgi:uncharacterized membrane protein
MTEMKHKSPRLLWLIILLFSICYSLLSIVRHNNFQSGAFDLGLYDQAVWQYSRFIYPFNTIKMRMILGDHLTLTLPLLAPLYWIWNDVKILLIFQAVWVSLSAYPIYKYILLRGLSKLEALILAGLYLTFYGVQFLIFFDFHPVAIGVGLLAWILYLFEVQKWKLFTLATFLLLLTQENMGLALFALSIIWFSQGKRKSLVILLGLLGLIYTFVAFKLIGYFSNVGLEYAPDFPDSLLQFTTRLIDSDEKRKVWLYSFSWFSFLPLLSPGASLAVISDLSQYFITGQQFSRMWSPFMHHRAILSIYLLIGSVQILVWIKNKKIKILPIVLVMLVLAISQQYYFHFSLNKLSKKSFWQEEQWMLDNYAVLSQVPPNASIAAQQSLVPHLSHREKIYLVYPRISGFKPGKSPCEQDSCWWLDFAGKPDYLVVDVHIETWLTMLLEERENFAKALKNMETSGAIQLVYKKGSARIYKINNNITHHIR